MIYSILWGGFYAIHLMSNNPVLYWFIFPLPRSISFNLHWLGTVTEGQSRPEQGWFPCHLIRSNVFIIKTLKIMDFLWICHLTIELISGCGWVSSSSHSPMRVYLRGSIESFYMFWGFSWQWMCSRMYPLFQISTWNVLLQLHDKTTKSLSVINWQSYCQAN